MSMRRFFIVTTVLFGACALLAGCEEEEKGPGVGGNVGSPPPAQNRLSRAEGEALAKELLAKWEERTGRSWVLAEKAAHETQTPFDNTYLLEGDDAQGQTYGLYTRTDIETWARETEKLVLMGSRIFHDAEALGSTNAVSCDMCHPHGANTHAETYPKFQVQIGRTILLRDMINWCLTHPARAPQMDPDDPRMRALEAYMLAQGKGKALAYGKH